MVARSTAPRTCIHDALLTQPCAECTTSRVIEPRDLHHFTTDELLAEVRRRLGLVVALSALSELAA